MYCRKGMRAKVGRCRQSRGGGALPRPPGIERSLNQAVPTERLVFSGLVISKQWAIVIQMLLQQSFNSTLSKREEVQKRRFSIFFKVFKPVLSSIIVPNGKKLKINSSRGVQWGTRQESHY